MQILVSSSDVKCRITHRIIVWHESPNSDLNDSLVYLWRGECQTAQREEKTLLSPNIASSSMQMLKN